MVLHICKKCNKEFNKKSHYITHINKKFSCNKDYKESEKSEKSSNILKNIIKNGIKHENIEKVEKIPSVKCLKDGLIKPQKTQKTANILKNNAKNEIIHEKLEKLEKNQCQKCLKVFSSKSNLNKHVKNICKIIEEKQEIITNNEINPEMMKKIEKIIKQNEFLIKENKKLKKDQKNQKKITNIKNQQINVNILNNVNIFDYGKENIDLIENKTIINAINRGMGITHITNIIESIYLNPELPKYQNIYISDINRRKCMIYSKNQWILSDIEKIYNLIDKVIEFSKEKHDEFRDLYKNNKNFQNKLEIFKKYLNFCDSEYLCDLENDDITKENRDKIKRCKFLTEKLENDVIKLFYNKKDIILKKPKC